MDFSKIAEDLKQESLFDLYRLRATIDHLLENPRRIEEIKRNLKPGQAVSYFDENENRLVEATVIKLNRTRLLVKNSYDKQQWNIPFYWVNLDRVDTDIVFSSKNGVEKGQLKVGDVVGFQDKQNNDVYGEITRLNRKTATVITNTNTKWRVSYQLLYLVIEGELGYSKKQNSGFRSINQQRLLEGIIDIPPKMTN